MIGMFGGSSWVAETQGEPLRIHLAMDATTYLVDQPIIVLACIENIGNEPYRDLPSLYAGDGYLRLSLIREPGNEAIPGSGPMREAVPTSEGITIGSGGYQCEAVNLLDWFGELSRDSNVLARAAWQHRLPPGQYRLEATLTGRTGIARLSRVAVKSDAVRFQIRTESDPPDPFLRDFVAKAPPATPSRDRFRAYSMDAGRSSFYMKDECQLPPLDWG